MANERKFIIRKEEDTNTVTYMEYEKREGLRMKPKNKLSYEDMVNVNEIVIINPSLIEKLITKKCNKNFKRIYDMYMLVEDDEEDGGFGPVLDEISRLEGLINNKYKKYMQDSEYQTMINKLLIVKQEIEARRKNSFEGAYAFLEEITKKSTSR